jgi:predicted N-acetyltransferase YhbS
MPPRLMTLEEHDLLAPLRADLDDLLGTAFESVRRPPLGRAWTHAAPTARVVAFTSDGSIAGQVAVIDAGRGARVTGIADLIVAPASRGTGVASALLDALLVTPLAREADIVFAASGHPRVRHHLMARGFRPVNGFELYWATPHACHRNPDWILRGRPKRPIEVIGDV